MDDKQQADQDVKNLMKLLQDTNEYMISLIKKYDWLGNLPVARAAHFLSSVLMYSLIKTWKMANGNILTLTGLLAEAWKAQTEDIKEEKESNTLLN